MAKPLEGGGFQKSPNHGGRRAADDRRDAGGGNEKHAYAGIEKGQAVLGRDPCGKRQQEGNDPRNHTQASRRGGIHCSRLLLLKNEASCRRGGSFEDNTNSTAGYPHRGYGIRTSCIVA